MLDYDVNANIREVMRLMPPAVKLVAVSKYHPSEYLQAAYDEGQRIFGESQVQELQRKVGEMPGDIQWHFIGHLQTNKVKYVVGKVDLIESVSSEHLLDAIEDRAAKVGVVQDILIEVNVGEEESKSGLSVAELPALAQKAAALPHVRLRGLMAIPPAAACEGENRHFFAEMRQLFVDIKEKLDDNNCVMDCLSMGMSRDYEDAVREGATLVRVGTALFGPRPPMGQARQE